MEQTINELKQKISELENSNALSNDANETIDRQKTLVELKAFKNKLHERIGAIDK